MGKIVSIQYLRALAAISVVLFHAGSQPLATPGATVAPATAIGAAGVDVFFVISGLIMWLVADAERVGPGGFLAHRIIRIVPLYWAVTLGKTMLGVILPRFGEHAHTTALHLLLSLFFIPHVSPDDGKILPVLTPGWTLDYEMFFYLAFAAALWLPPRTRLAAISAWLGGLVVVGQLLHPGGAIAGTFTDPLLLEFLIGVWIGALATRRVAIPAWAALATLAAGVGAFALVAVFPSDLPRVLVWGGPAALVVGGALFAERTMGAPKSRLLLALGDGSYSIYLVHGFFVIALASLVRRQLAVSPPVSAGIVVAAAVAAAIGGVVCFNLLERRLGRTLRGWYDGLRRVGARDRAVATVQR